MWLLLQIDLTKFHLFMAFSSDVFAETEELSWL